MRDVKASDSGSKLSRNGTCFDNLQFRILQIKNIALKYSHNNGINFAIYNMDTCNFSSSVSFWEAFGVKLNIMHVASVQTICIS